MDINEAVALINLFLRGEISEVDKIKILELIERDKRIKKIYFSMSKQWLESYCEVEEEAENRKKAWQDIQLLIARNVMRNRKKLIYRTAFASVMIASVIFAAIFVLHIHNRNTSQINALLSNARTEIVVPYGSKVKLSLPDSSTVWVNAGSTLSYNNSFSKSNRDVTLDGEAYFEVAKNRQLPFKVFANNVCVEAKGTSFNIESYRQNVTTTLITGTVLISSKYGGDQILRPNQSVCYNSINREFDKVKNVTNAELYSSWKDNIWVIRSMKMDEFIERLEKRYNVVIIENGCEFQNKRISASLSNETIEQVMRALKSTMGVEYSINKNVITLRQIDADNIH